MGMILAVLACASALAIGFFWGRADGTEAESARHAERLAKYNAIRKLLAEHAAFVASEYHRQTKAWPVNRDVGILLMSARALESDVREVLASLD